MERKWPRAALPYHAQAAAVFDHTRTLPQGDRDASPSLIAYLLSRAEYLFSRYVATLG